MKKRLILSLIIACFAVIFAWTQALPAFTADTGKKSLMGKEVGIPYTNLISYFGYIKAGAQPDEVVKGKKMYYIYVWVPAVSPEIGLRMISPVSSLKPEPKPKATDFISSEYNEGKNDKTNFFDTYIVFERASDIIDPKDIASKINSTKWVTYGSNDDSSELPAQPSGNKYNSVLRIVSEPSNPAKALVRGLYRIGFTTFKTGEVQGTFLAQVGSIVKLPGVVIEKDKKALIEKVK